MSVQSNDATRPSRWRSLSMRVVSALLVLAALLAVAAYAQADTLRASHAVALARQANPTLQAARHRADAAAERVPQAGALPDPMLSFGMRNWVARDFAASAPMSTNAIQLTQRFPWPGKLGFRHPSSSERLEFTAPLPGELRELVESLRAKNTH